MPETDKASPVLPLPFLLLSSLTPREERFVLSHEHFGTPQQAHDSLLCAVTPVAFSMGSSFSAFDSLCYHLFLEHATSPRSWAGRLLTFSPSLPSYYKDQRRRWFDRHVVCVRQGQGGGWCIRQATYLTPFLLPYPRWGWVNDLCDTIPTQHSLSPNLDRLAVASCSETDWHACLCLVPMLPLACLNFWFHCTYAWEEGQDRRQNVTGRVFPQACLHTHAHARVLALLHSIIHHTQQLARLLATPRENSLPAALLFLHALSACLAACFCLAFLFTPAAHALLYHFTYFSSPHSIPLMRHFTGIHKTCLCGHAHLPLCIFTLFLCTCMAPFLCLTLQPAACLICYLHDLLCLCPPLVATCLYSALLWTGEPTQFPYPTLHILLLSLPVQYQDWF